MFLGYVKQLGWDRAVFDSAVFDESRKCVCFNETDFRNYSSEPVPAIRTYIERLKYVNNVVLVTI